MRRRNTTLLAVTALLALSARAQIAPVAAPASLEVTLAYGADRTDGVVGGCGCFWMAGGKAEANANLGRGLSAVAELAGSHVSNINSAHEDLTLVSYLFGPRYSYLGSKRFVPFVQILIGGVHGFDSLFPDPNGTVPNPDAFAYAAGGGLNVNLSPHFAIRAGQADYFQTHLPNDTNDRENHLRLSAGIVFRFD